MSRILIFSWANFIMRGDWGGENETTSSGKCQRSQVNQLPASKLLLKWLKMSTRINKKKRERESVVLIYTSELSLAQYFAYLSSLLQYSLFLSLPLPFPLFRLFSILPFQFVFPKLRLRFMLIKISYFSFILYRAIIPLSGIFQYQLIYLLHILYLYLYYLIIVNFILRIDCSC